ncbi:MAG TPA: hypothetical protein VFH45_08060 [Acidimicrobiales bacterium]|nr:hypothetical protein [Acidimicrobiales bacterium]
MQPAIGATTAVVRRTTGIVGVALFAVGVVATVIHLLAPGTDAGPSVVELYVLGHYHTQQAGVVLQAAELVLFVIFAGHLSARVRRADAAAGDSWTPPFLIGAAGVAALSMAAVGAQGAYQELSHSQALPAEVSDIYHLANGLAAGSGLLLAVMLLAVGVSALLNGTVPVPLAWVALATAGVGVVAAGGIGTARTTFGILSSVQSLMFLGWALGVSTWLLLTEEPAPPSLAAPGPAPAEG